MTWDGERFGTVATGLFFSRLAVDSSSEGEMAHLRALTWNRIAPLLRDLDAIRCAA
jgi:hypothetical protein